MGTESRERITDPTDWILNFFNATTADYPKNTLIHRVFEKQAAGYPGAPALVFDGQTMTYGELNQKANQLARHLRSKAVGPGTVAGVMLERSFAMIIAIFGVLKAGGAYMPILPDNPVKRTEYMLKRSGARLVLTKRKHMPQPGLLPVDLVYVDEQNAFPNGGDNLPLDNAGAGPRDLAYVIFTSGSTGEPKGVMVEHYSLVNRLCWMQKKYSLNRGDVLLQKTPFVFDVSVWEIFWWCITGAKLAILAPGHEKYPQAVVEAVARDKVTVLHFVPSMLNSFLNYVGAADAAGRLAWLKRIFSSGEALLPSHVQKFNRILYQRNETLLTNLYGPTEATVDVSYYDCPPGVDLEKVPIGKPIDNIKLFVFNDDQLQPPGEEGELCISGDGLARGYINDPELTKSKFVDNPVMPGVRMYKTGDRVRLGRDGNIEYLGRMDQQVKIRGLRVELGEIEALLTKHAAVEACVVTLKDRDRIIPALIAYIVAQTPVTPGALRAYLKEFVPDYMVPNKYVFLPEMPLSVNGKIDRKMLPDPTRVIMKGGKE